MIAPTTKIIDNDPLIINAIKSEPIIKNGALDVRRMVIATANCICTTSLINLVTNDGAVNVSKLASSYVLI